MIKGIGIMILFTICLMLKYIYSWLNTMMSFLALRKKIHTVATVEELRRKQPNYDKKGEKIVSTSYVYYLKIVHDEKECLVKYIETVGVDKPSRININDTIQVYYDPEKKKVVNVEEAKRIMRFGPLTILGYIASILLMLFVCWLIMELYFKTSDYLNSF